MRCDCLERKKKVGCNVTSKLFINVISFLISHFHGCIIVINMFIDFANIYIYIYINR